MTRVIVRRVLAAIPVLLLATLFAFALVHLAPGDPVSMYLSSDLEMADEATVERIRHQMGLDRPIYVQYITWLSRALQGDLGYSYVTRRPVTQTILETLPASISLVGISLILSITIGLAIGTLSAWKQRSIVDYVFTVVTLIGYSVPGFFLALLLLYVFSYRLKWLPSSGMRSLRPTSHSANVDLVLHYIMPVMAYTVRSLVMWVRYQRNSLVDVLNRDYLRTARAKGLSERAVLLRHAWRNSLIPIATLVGFSISGLVGGSFILETIFAWPGMGRLGIDAITRRDYPVSMGILLVSSIMIVFGNLIADLLYTVLDPRISYEKAAES